MLRWKTPFRRTIQVAAHNRAMSCSAPNRQAKVMIHKTEDGSHLFQPVASKPSISPTRRTHTWLEAYRAREASRDPKTGKSTTLSFDFNKSQSNQKVYDRTVDDSFSYVILPFKDDPWFLDAYINSFGRLRFGQIFQDLDALAGVIAHNHCMPAEPMIVTASVDRVTILKRLDQVDDKNITLSGHVTWTGRSSMEITIKAAQTSTAASELHNLKEGQIKDEDVFLTAGFTFVARDPLTQKSFAINRLVPRNAKERADFERASKFNAHKKELAKTHDLAIAPPTEEEAKLIHDMWIETRDKPALPAHTKKMTDTVIHSTQVMQPQYRNRHSYMIFGGYLLRTTFELAYACAAAFTHSSPRFVSLDSTTFRAPVPVGSVCYLTATVVNTIKITKENDTEVFTNNSKPGTLVQVRVDSTVKDLDHDTTTNTGQFTYSYFVEDTFFDVVPESYSEMMQYVEGRRTSQSTKKYHELMKSERAFE